MAGKNDFAALKTFGTKELKFKQGVHMDAAHRNKTFGEAILAAPIYGQAKGGVCAALTMEWLKAQLSEGVYTPFDSTPSRPAADNFRHQLTVWHAAQFQIAYDAESETKTEREATTMLASEYGLKLKHRFRFEIDGKQRRHSPTEMALTQAHMFCPEGRGIYLGVDMKEGRSRFGHAVGISKKPDGVRFFDANVGAYLVTDQLHFYERWVSLLRDKLNWEVRNCCGFIVSNVAGVRPETVRV